MTLSFWFWLLLAAVFAAAEALSRGSYVLPFAVGSLLAAGLESAGASADWQWAAFLGVSSALTVVLRRTLDRPPTVAGAEPPSLHGRVGVVVEDLRPEEGRGRVRVEREEWRAEAPAHGALPAGTRVIVDEVRGTRLLVRPAEEAPGRAEAGG